MISRCIFISKLVSLVTTDLSLHITQVHYIIIDYISVLVTDYLGKKMRGGRGLLSHGEDNIPSAANSICQAE